MATYTGTSGADSLSETTFRGDTLVGRGGDDTYDCWASFWYDPGFPEYGIPGETVYYRTDIVEEINRGYDTVYYHIGIHGIVVSGSELPSIERIYLINHLGSQNTTFDLLLGAGAQKVFGSTLGETISGGAGNDTISGASGNDSLIGGDGADSLLGATGKDTLDGGSGLDRLAGGNGNDVYYLQNAGDVVTELAGDGTDEIHVSADYKLSNNVENLVLGAGNIDGTGNGADNRIYAGTGNNVLLGGAGLDTVSFSVGVTASGVNANLATGLASGGSGSDALSGFENLEGTLFYNDTLQGNAVGNRLYGLGGSDVLNGGGGNDTLIGGAGYDSITGGAGADRFRFEAVTDATADLRFKEVLEDFVSGVDRIDLSAIDANPFMSGNQAFLESDLSYSPISGILYADVEGSFGYDFQIQLGTTAHPATVFVADLIL